MNSKSLGWLSAIESAPLLCGAPDITCFSSFVDGVWIAETNHGGDLVSMEWRRIESFRRKWQWRESTNSPYTIFTAFHCENPVDAFFRLFDEFATIEVGPEGVRPGYMFASLEAITAGIAKRPGMYIGEPSVQALYAFLNGYSWRADQLKGGRENADIMHEFCQFYANWIGLEQCLSSWLHQAWLSAGNPGNADRVLRVFDEFWIHSRENTECLKEDG
jgi:hypothetical protein